MGFFDGAAGIGAAMFPTIAASNAGSILSYIGQQEANDLNRSQANSNNAWMQWMSGSAHQREVEDLKAAGLNPILSANSGASSPSGAQSVAQNTMQSMAASAQEAAQLMMQAKRLDADISKQNVEKDLLRAQTTKAQTESQVIRKGIPEAELKNDVYDLARPAVKKLKQWFQPSLEMPKRK